MPESTIDTIDALLRDGIEATEDSEVHFKLRTARQLLQVVREEKEQAVASLANADLDDELRARLRELGYVD